MGKNLQIVVYKSDPWWIIHGLDPEFVTVARSLEDVPSAIQNFLTVLFAASKKFGVEPFYGYPPKAPLRFWKMYEQAEPWTVAFPPVLEDLAGC